MVLQKQVTRPGELDLSQLRRIGREVIDAIDLHFKETHDGLVLICANSLKQHISTNFNRRQR